MKNRLLPLVVISILNFASSLAMDGHPQFAEFERKKQKAIDRLLGVGPVRAAQAPAAAVSHDLSTFEGLTQAVAQFKQRIEAEAETALVTGKKHLVSEEDFDLHERLDSAYSAFIPHNLRNRLTIESVTPQTIAAVDAKCARVGLKIGDGKAQEVSREEINKLNRSAQQIPSESSFSYCPTFKQIGIGTVAIWASLELYNAYRTADAEKWEKAGYLKPLLLATQATHNMLKRPAQLVSLIKKRI